MNERKKYITFLSVLSAISVVVLHTNGCFWQFSKSRYWTTSNVIECVFYFAVPIFFMITGITLMDYREKYSTKVYFKKRIVKTVIPFLIWSFIALVYDLFYLKIVDVKLLNFQYIFNGVFGTTFLSVYWFFIPLFVIYLLIPIFSSIEKEKRKKVFMYVIILIFILNSVLPLINDIFKLELVLPFKIALGIDYLPYVLVGYLIDNFEIKHKQRKIIYFLGIVGLFVHIILTHILSFDAGQIVTTYKGYNNVPCILYSIAVFVFLKNIFERINNEKIIKYIDYISKYTFAIYLMHFYVIQILERQLNLSAVSIMYRLGMPFIIIPICILITWLLRKIPIIKKIVP